MSFDFLDIWLNNDFFAVLNRSLSRWGNFVLSCVGFDFLDIGLNDNFFAVLDRSLS